MRRIVLLLSAVLLLLLLLSGCASKTDLSKASSQLSFGVKAARMNLWREATFRFARAVQIDPNSAMARNNLAVAYEGSGDFEKARTEYLKALQIDKSNQYIQKNYSRFMEFYTRNRRREAPETKERASAAAPKTAPATPPATAPVMAGAPTAPGPGTTSPPQPAAPVPPPASAAPPAAPAPQPPPQPPAPPPPGDPAGGVR